MGNSIRIILGEFATKAGEPYQHIHGELRILIAQRQIPGMGYFGEKDVCFNEWIDILVNIRRMIINKQNSYKHEGYEQGQPTYLFEAKSDSIIALSLLPSSGSKRFKDKTWLGIEFAYADFKSEYLRFKDEFLAKIEEIAPNQSEFWKAKFDMR